MTIHTYKLCQNRGNARIWMEGKRLTSNGWNVGDHFDRRVLSHTIVLIKNPEGRYKVAGKGDRPIIDMNGKYLTEFFDGATHYVSSILTESIIITGA